MRYCIVYKPDHPFLLCIRESVVDVDNVSELKRILRRLERSGWEILKKYEIEK